MLKKYLPHIVIALIVVAIAVWFYYNKKYSVKNLLKKQAEKETGGQNTPTGKGGTGTALVTQPQKPANQFKINTSVYAKTNGVRIYDPGYSVVRTKNKNEYAGLVYQVSDDKDWLYIRDTGGNDLRVMSRDVTPIKTA